MSKTIAILGCGWLGLPLAKTLLNSKFSINGSTTSKEKLNDLKKSGISPFLISLSEHAIIGNIKKFLNEVDTIIINVPPKVRAENKKSYVKKMTLLHKAVKKSQVQNLIFISSISVYGDVVGPVTEETNPKPNCESGKQLLASENIFKKDKELQTSIIRFGGLIGRDRHPIYMLSGKKGLSNGNHPVNLIHQNDCILILETVIKNKLWNETYNGVFPFHPKKEDYYTSEAIKRGLQKPIYNFKTNTKGKIVLSNKLISNEIQFFNHTI